ncbi:MAG TPA: hypothetical protein VN851_20615 [Thermoanaerobaculia bacterium]|nr:hypothetical protein [Thermoanaerobaculia bacterium]
MPERVRLLALSTRATIALLLAGAFLVVLGFFDEFLDWDIFAPGVEKALTGVFASCVALGAFGLAISLAAGLRDAVAAIERLGPERPADQPVALALTRRRALIWLGAMFGLLGLTVLGFNFANDRILAGRQRTFKALARHQMKELGPRWAAELERFREPCPTCVAPGLRELVRAFDAQSFCQSVDVYLADPADPGVLWRYQPSNDAEKPAMLERQLVSRDQERAISQALHRQPAWLDQMTGDLNWVSYQTVKATNGRPLAVVEIFANDRESYGDYLSVATDGR